MAAEPRRLVLLRHGRTAWNQEHRIQGQRDVDLDEVGHAQAVAVAPVMATLAPSVLWSSDLARARQTTAYLAQSTGLVARHDARLREYALGEREGLTHAEYAALDADEYAAFRVGDFDAVAAGEQTHAVRARMVEVVQEILADLAPGGLAVAVSHGAAIRVAVAGLLGLPDSAARSLRGVENCGWVELEQPADRPVRLVAYNRTVAAARPDFAPPAPLASIPRVVHP